MADITSARLSVGRITSGTEFAELSIAVRWTNREVQEDFWYRLSGFLVERDNDRDFFDMLPDGNIHWHSIGNRDDFIGTIGKRWVRPSGSKTRTYTLRRNWDFGNQEAGAEEYNGVATIVPEVSGDVKFSNEVGTNLG